VARPAGLTELTVFARGDASSVTTWSGLPQGCADALEAHGVTVHRVDISPGPWNRRVVRLIDRSPRKWPLLRGWKPSGDLLSHFIASRAARRTIVEAGRKYRGSQCNLFMTFSFSSRGISNVPAVHFCDQCFAEVLQRDGRTRLSRGEAARLAEEEAALRGADLLISTSIHCIEFLREHYGLPNVFDTPLYGMSLVGYRGEPLSSLESKRRSTDIVFVGSYVRRRGLDILLQAFRLFNRSGVRGYTLHIVGFEEGAVPGHWENTKWHGRLDKGNAEEAQLYWGLLEKAHMFIIPSRIGPLPGVILEAQYLGTPVITTNVWRAEQIVRDGETGLVLETPTADSLCEAMDRLASDALLWETLARTGHERALQWTWERASATMLEQLARVTERCQATTTTAQG
jgi:glycosyltransferase involved in cell wall biosynthesis